MGLMDYVKYFDEQDNRNAMKNFASSELPDLLKNDPSGRSAMLRYAQVNPQAVPDVLTAMIDPKAQQARLQQQALMELTGGGGGQQAQPAQVQWQSARQEPNQDPMGVMQQAGQVALSPLVQPMQEQPQQAPNDDARRRKLLAFAFPEKYGQLVADEFNPKNRADTEKALMEAKAEKSKLELADKALADKKASALQELNRIIGEDGKNNGLISRAINQTSDQLIGGTVGRTGYLARLTGSPDAANLDSTLNTIRSNSALSKLGELKSQSPSGASGFGALSEKELQLIESNIRGLDTAQSAEQMKKNLSELREELKTMRGRISGDSPASSAQPKQSGSRVIKYEDLP